MVNSVCGGCLYQWFYSCCCSYKYCFEVATAKRPYLFCAEREFEQQQWVDAFQKVNTLLNTIRRINISF